MSCKFCDLDAGVARNGGELEGGVLVGQWAFTKDDELARLSTTVLPQEEPIAPEHSFQ